MIVTVTMNPAIDKTVDIGKFEHGGLNRIKNVEIDAGGKGINVSKTIKELGGETIATGFIGGTTGQLIENVLNEMGIKNDFVKIESPTRTNTKLVEEGGIVTELNEPGPVITEEAMEELLTKLEGYASEETLFVLAGSVPASVDKGIYGKIADAVHAKGAKVFIDADGELFVKSLDSKPDYIKPNNVELAEFFGVEGDITVEDTVGMAEKLMARGIEHIAVSMGKDGAVFVSNEEKFKCKGLKVKAHSTVGAGDAMVAAISYGVEKGLSYREAAKLGVATSAGAVTTIGTKPPTREVVDELLAQVECEEI